MLAVTTYPQDYIDGCRALMEAQITAYQAVASAATPDKSAPARHALESFEPLFFNNLVLVLDECFLHRTRAIEGKDGNPLNEVRMLCSSILHNKAVFSADKTIKYKPEMSVLGLHIGDDIKLTESQLLRLSKAYFAEIERKFT